MIFVKIGAEFREKDIDIILNILNKFSGESIELNEVLIEMMKKKVISSDILFMILKKLKENGLLDGKRGYIELNKKIDKKMTEEIKKKIEDRLKKIKKVFVTPLEVAKFYQCPRRVWLEKIVLAKQFKEEVGKVWDGEVIHYSSYVLLSNFKKEDVEKIIENAVEKAFDKYAGKTTLEKDELIEFLWDLYDFASKEFDLVFPERKIESIKLGLIGTADAIGISEKRKVYSIDIKSGGIKGKRIKKEHLIQNIGEVILAENYFRTKVTICQLIYFKSKTVVKIDIDKRMKNEFLMLKRRLEKLTRTRNVPSKSRLYNYRKRVCKGCHVKMSCENIEKYRRLRGPVDQW